MEEGQYKIDPFLTNMQLLINYRSGSVSGKMKITTKRVITVHGNSLQSSELKYGEVMDIVPDYNPPHYGYPVETDAPPYQLVMTINMP